MPKPVTYYAQTPDLDELVEEFGSQLEKLSRGDKLGLRMLLGAYIYLKEIEDEWTLDAVVTETREWKKSGDRNARELSHTSAQEGLD